MKTLGELKGKILKYCIFYNVKTTVRIVEELNITKLVPSPRASFKNVSINSVSSTVCF
jgi:hypothetical protein